MHSRLLDTYSNGLNFGFKTYKTYNILVSKISKCILLLVINGCWYLLDKCENDNSRDKNANQCKS